MPDIMNTKWKVDLYPFVGKAFDFAIANGMSRLSPILGETKTRSVNYQLTGGGAFGELQPYDGSNLNMVPKHRGFNAIISPTEFTMSFAVGRDEAIIDKTNETKRVGKQLGEAASGTIYNHTLNVLANAFNADGLHNGGDGKPWAAADHPVASKGSNGRDFIADPDMGTYSNLMTKQMTVSAITEAQTMVNRFVTPSGMPFMGEMDTLLISPELEPEAKKLTGKNAQLYPDGTATNAANPIQGLQYIVIGGGRYGFTAKQWAICDRKRMKELFQIIFRQRPTVMETALDNPLKALYTAYACYGIGWGDARMIIFSNP